MNRIKIGLIALIILATLVRLLVLLNSDNSAGSTPMGRLIDSISILDNPRLSSNFNGNTPVLHHYLLAAVLYFHFWPDPVVPARIFTMLFGIFLIIPFYFLIKILLNKRTAFYSGILLSLYPLHAIQSTLTTSDAVFHFFFFSCLYYFFKFKLKEKKIFWLVLSAVLFNIAAMLRFESWIFIPLLSIFLYKDGKKYSVLFFLLSLILPSIWLYLCYHYHGDAFFSFVTSTRTAHTEIVLGAAHSKEILGWLNILYKTLGRMVVISGIFGIIYSFFKKNSLHLAIFFLYLYSFYTINTITYRMWYLERYSILLGLLLLPYSILCIEKISVLLRLKPVILLLPFIFFSTLEFKKIMMCDIRGSILPTEIKEIANWLKANVLSSDKLILGTDRWNLSDQDIIVRSGATPRNFFLVTTSLIESSNPITKESIGGYITNVKPRWLVLNSTGLLQKVLNFDMSQETFSKFGYTFELIYASKDMAELGRHNIYKIHYHYKDN